MEQNTNEWLKARLGNFTASAIHQLMCGGKGGERFGKTALSYIYQVTAERDILPAYLSDDILFEVYLQQTTVTSKAMDWGHDNEPLAAERYALRTGYDVAEVGIFFHPEVPHFSASPDRIATDLLTGTQRVVEIKCPSPKKFMEYRSTIHDAESLRAVCPEYYWQIQAELACTGLREAHFVAFCPFLQHNIHIVPIPICDTDVALMVERVREANKLIGESILNDKQHESDRKTEPDAA